jgi:hypothetical protein
MILLYNCHYVIVDCEVMLLEFIETLECITPLWISLHPIMVENPLVVLCLADRTPVEVGWQVPPVTFMAFYTLVHEWNV